MKHAVKRVVLALLSGLLFCQGLAILAYTEDAPLERDCETVEEFLSELEKDIGGIINLSGDGPFVIDQDINIAVNEPVTVNLPSDGIEIAEQTLSTFHGPITFTGTQGFTVNEEATLSLYDGVSVNVMGGEGEDDPIAVYFPGSTEGDMGEIMTDSSVVLHAEGKNAIAIRFEEGGFLNLGYAKVSADGENAIAVYSGGYLNMHRVVVRAGGDDPYAIFCMGEAELGQVSATGAVEANNIYSILSEFSPSPHNLEELEVELDMPFRQTVVYQNLACGSSPVVFPGLEQFYYIYQMPDADWESSVLVDFHAVWDDDGLDYSVPGDYNATATLQPVMPVPGLSVPSLTHEVTVVSENRAALFEEFGRGTHMVVNCLAPIEDAEEILFWIYEDDGWRELTATGNAIYAEEWSGALHPDYEYYWAYPLFQVSGLEEDTLYWFVAQVIGGPMEGFSNLWQAYSGTELVGDRTGTDRYSAKPTTLPPLQNVQTPPPETNTPDTSGDSGVSGGRAGSSGRVGRDSEPADVSEPALPTSAAEAFAPVQEAPSLPKRSAPAGTTQITAGSGDASAASLPEEWEDESAIAISGKRLLALLESGEPVVFIKRGARILVDRDALLALEIKENQLLAVQVTPLGDSYIVTFELDGVEIDLPYTLISPEIPAVEAQKPMDESPAENDPVDFSAPKDPTEASSGVPFAAILMIGGGITSGGGYWLVRKYRLPHR